MSEELNVALRCGVLAIVRLPAGLDPVPAALAVVDAGVGAVEITLTTPRALEAIAQLVAHETGAIVGAGSIRTVAELDAAVDAGARFVVTPTTRTDVIAAAARRGVPVLAGGLTPTELDAAHQAGAAYQKLFPASLVGPEYLREVLAPMPDLEVVPTGGIGLASVPGWRQSGAVAVAVGSALVDAATVAAADTNELRTRASQFLEAWESAGERMAQESHQQNLTMAKEQS